MKWQTLAPELIYEVLRQCRSDFCKRLSVTNPHSFPWYLGHICRTWREVFVTSPQFWNTLKITLYFSHEWYALDEEYFRERALEVARISLVRSRDRPISFRLIVGGYSQASPAEITMCQQMIGILVACSARWHDAYIDIPAKEMATLYAAKNRMPLLRSIQLELQTQMWGDNYETIAAKLYSDFLVDAPQLTRICFKASMYRFWNISWSLTRITVMHFHNAPPLSQLLAYLSQMSCLEELVFLASHVGCDTSNDGIAPVTLPHLKFLYSEAVTLLQIVDTPALQELHIQNDISRIENASTLKANISRYFQPIRHLSKLGIISHHMGDNTALIIEHMHREARVDHLTLYSAGMPDLLKILDNYPQMGFLKTVTFELSTSLNKVAKESFLETVTSWKRGPGGNRGIGPFHNLTQMSFNLLNGYDERFVDSLKLHLSKQGMHYSISKDGSALSIPRFVVGAL